VRGYTEHTSLRQKASPRLHDSDALRRKLNDDRRRRFGALNRPLALVCECGDPECCRTILLTPDEYDALRPGAVLHARHTAATSA